MGKKKDAKETKSKAAVVTPAEPPATKNPLGLPWHADYEHERLVVDKDYNMVGLMNTPELAELVASTVSAGDLDAKAEVTRLTALVGHYQHRSEMTPSERQSYLNETGAQSIQPENWYIEKVASPAKALRDAALDAAASLVLDGTPEDDDVVVALRAAVKKFNKAIPSWM